MLSLILAPIQEQHAASGPLTVEFGLMFWTVVVFLLLLLILKKFAYPALLGAVEARERALEARLQALQIHAEDLEETFVRSSGPGGQHVNKTSTCVRLLHRPTGLSVKVQRSRSQGLNRFLARRLLADRVEQQLGGATSTHAQQRDKIRRQKQRRARRTKLKRRMRGSEAPEVGS